MLNDPGTWIRSPKSGRGAVPRAPHAAGERWVCDVLRPRLRRRRAAGRAELTGEEKEILVCAFGAGDWLTGPFGIREDPPPDLDAAARAVWVERQIEPMVPWVRASWIEVPYITEADGDGYTVIPHERLAEALADPIGSLPGR
jgi:hypothetical protein